MPEPPPVPSVRVPVVEPAGAEHPSVLVIGELNVDLIATGLASAPILGREILAQDFRIVLGSASAIFASGVARLGHPVTFIGKVGADDFGRFCISELARLGVDATRVLVESQHRTGVTICLSTASDRAQVTFPGAIAAFAEAEIPEDAFTGHAHLHLSCFALQTQLKSSFGRLFKKAKQAGMTTSFDPNSDLREETGHQVRELLSDVDVLFINETEARDLVGQQDAERALEVLCRETGEVVLKLGPHGALYGRGSHRARITGHTVPTVDTTGAGDSFAAGFVSRYVRRASTADCLRAANGSGALSTRAAGGTGAQPTEQELASFLSQQPAALAERES